MATMPSNMDAEMLATTLVSGGQSEAEKLRLIRQVFPSGGGHLKPADVAYVQRRLGADRRLAKLAIAFGDASRNKEFAMAELFSGSTITPGLVATRYKWLYTTEILLNEAFLLNELMKMSHSTRLKILYGIGHHVDDVELGDRLWEVVRTNYSVRYASRLLAACSNEVILREMTNYQVVQLTDAQMFRILQKRFESGVELLRQLCVLKKNGTRRHDVCFDNSMHLILLKDFEKGFSILVDSKMAMRLGANRTRTLLKALAVCGDSQTVTKRVIRYVQHVDPKALRRYASKELYLECFLERHSDFDPTSYFQSYFVMEWLSGFGRFEKRRFLEALFQKMYYKSIMEVPMKVFPEMWYVLDEDESVKIVKRRLRKRDYSLARTCSEEYFWRSMLPCKQSFRDLKDLLATERSTDGRGNLYSLMIASPIYHHDATALEYQLKFVVSRCRNENRSVQNSVICAIDRYYKLRDGFKADLWCSVKEFCENTLLSSEPFRTPFGSLFSALKGHRDTERVKEFAKLLSKAHLTIKSRYLANFEKYFRSASNHDIALIFKILLDDQEAYFAKKQETDFADLPNGWRILSSVVKLKIDIDLSQYPNTVAFLKYVVSPGQKKDSYLSDHSVLNAAYKLIKGFLNENDYPVRSEIRTDETVDFKSLAERIRKTKNVANLDLKVILHDSYASEVAFLRRVAQLLAASNAISPAILQQALDLSADGDRRMAATQFLAMCMPLDDFMNHFGKFIPKKAKINAGEIDDDFYKGQTALIAATKLLADSAAALTILAGFMQGDYLKMAVGTFNYYCAKSPPSLVLPVLANNLSGGAVSAQKHFIRWFFVYAADNVAKLNEVIALANSGSTKLELFKVVYRMVEDSGEEVWPTLKACLGTVRGEDRQTMHFILTEKSIDDHLGNCLPAFFQAVYALGITLPEKEKSQFDYFYSRAAGYVADLPQDLARRMCMRALEDDLSTGSSAAYVRSYVVNFAMHDVPANVEFLRNQLDVLLRTKARFAKRNVRAIVEGICAMALTEEHIMNTDHAVLLDLLQLLASHVENFFVEQVYVELTLILMDTSLPEDFNFSRDNDIPFIREYTIAALELLCERLNEMDARMFATLSPLLVKTIQPLMGKLPTFRARMLEVHTRHMPPGFAWFLVDCLPDRKSDVYEDDWNVYERFIRTVQSGTDVGLKVLLNRKLYKLNYDNVSDNVSE